ncbi:phage tail protein [Selenomonas sp. F0473]|uniref:phage tail protein n=1 Tax=Selenomonas sp. F0473 TaxID=999423 RepID=UPI0025F1A0A7|nr:phage tail protein [Selenomonas sp. F0473]
MPKTYTTISGDEWDVIAKKELGGERYTALLMQVNPDHLWTVIFTAGVVLTLPEITVPIPASLPPWRS